MRQEILLKVIKVVGFFPQFRAGAGYFLCEKFAFLK